MRLRRKRAVDAGRPLCAVVLVLLFPHLTGCAPTPPSSVSSTYVNPTHRWSVVVPGGWRVDDKDPSFVRIQSPPGPPRGLVSIFTARNVRGESLDGITDALLRFWLDRTGRDRAMTSSRRRVTVSGDIPAIEVVHLLGVGVVGKSRKVICVVGDRVYSLDAETYVQSWDALEPYFDQILISFTPPK